MSIAEFVTAELRRRYQAETDAIMADCDARDLPVEQWPIIQLPDLLADYLREVPQIAAAWCALSEDDRRVALLALLKQLQADSKAEEDRYRHLTDVAEKRAKHNRELTEDIEAVIPGASRWTLRVLSDYFDAHPDEAAQVALRQRIRSAAGIAPPAQEM
jgi:flagellar motility protein MotE (MotC chaperone)